MNVYYCETHEVGGTVRCHVCQAVNAERERIIGLLQNEWLPIADVDECIALIKGENK